MSNDISIIIPVFCTSDISLQWLDECIASACIQNCEVVVYNDGSTVDISNTVKKHDVDVFIRCDKNLGVSYARNRAIAYASKSLILPLDCDDRLALGAVESLLEMWDGHTPVYSDIRKFGDEDDPHYTLLEFDCSHILDFVGFTSVNVLHSKEQHISIGGYDPSIHFYEDGEYNARLLGTYCGVRCPKPLIEYRIHESQRTKQYKFQARDIAKYLLEKIRSYDMPCSSCSKRRTASSHSDGAKGIPMSQSTSVQLSDSEVVNMPLELDGKILCRYFGGEGKARHYYNGPVTKTSYKVLHGQIIYVDPKDARQVEDTANNSCFVLVTRIEHKQEIPSVSQPISIPVVERLPIHNFTEKSQVATEEVELPDISNMSVKDIRNLDISAGLLPRLLEIELNNHNRDKVVRYLRALQ